MSFVYEMVGEENRELWESIGWKDVFESPLDFYRKDYWSIDRTNEIFLIAIGKYIDTPHYYDMSYKQRIIRMEIVERIESAANDKVKIIWDIYNIYIPKSVWLEKEKIIIAIKSAFSVNRGIVSEEEIDGISAEVKCNPRCVEVDYNGK